MEGEGFGPPAGALVVLGAGTVAGLVTGALIGRGAERAVAEGRSVGAGQRAAALGGVVLVGSALGALAAWRMADDFPPTRVDVAPAVGRGGYGLRVRMEM